MTDPLEHELVQHLKGFLSHRRLQRIESVLDQRTRLVTLVLEDVYQPHNASAVLRTCECMGIQDVHVVEASNRYRVNTDVSLGAGKWLTLKRYADISACAGALRAEGYRLVAATPHAADCTLDQMPAAQRTAVLLGTEESGLSQTALHSADLRVSVPIHGFTESYNVSVCAAMILRHIVARLRQSDIPWRLSVAEKNALRLAWYRKSIRGVDLIEARFRAERQSAGRPTSASSG